MRPAIFSYVPATDRGFSLTRACGFLCVLGCNGDGTRISAANALSPPFCATWDFYSWKSQANTTPFPASDKKAQHLHPAGESISVCLCVFQLPVDTKHIFARLNIYVYICWQLPGLGCYSAYLENTQLVLFLAWGLPLSLTWSIHKKSRRLSCHQSAGLLTGMRGEDLLDNTKAEIETLDSSPCSQSPDMSQQGKLFHSSSFCQSSHLPLHWVGLTLAGWSSQAHDSQSVCFVLPGAAGGDRLSWTLHWHSSDTVWWRLQSLFPLGSSSWQLCCSKQFYPSLR